MQVAPRIVSFAGWMLLGMTVISLGLGGWLASRALLFTSQAVTTTGVIAGFRETPQSDGRVAYAPRVTFTSGPDERTTIFGQLTSMTPRYRIGDKVPLRHLKGDPGSARIDTFTDNALGPSVALGLGLLTGATALLLIRSGRRAN